MKERLAAHWGLILARGILLLILGIMAPFVPAAALFLLAILFGVVALTGGIIAIYHSTQLRVHDQYWRSLLIEGIVGVLAGITTIVWPGITLVFFAYVVAAWAFVGGIFAIATAIQLRRSFPGEVLYLLSAVLSVAFGIAAAIFPLLSLLYIVYVLAFFAIVTGVALIALALRLRGQHTRATA